jgi:hypothetical protein
VRDGDRPPMVVEGRPHTLTNHERRHCTKQYEESDGKRTLHALFHDASGMTLMIHEMVRPAVQRLPWGKISANFRE